MGGRIGPEYATESGFNSFKNKRIYGNRYATRAEITAETFDYIEVFYNRKRRHSRLGYQSPVQYLENWLMTEEVQKQVA